MKHLSSTSKHRGRQTELIAIASQSFAGQIDAAVRDPLAAVAIDEIGLNAS